jgi:hypothetical protein
MRIKGRPGQIGRQVLSHLCSAGPVRCRHLGRSLAGAGLCFGQHGDEEDQQSRDENPAAGQHDTDDHEQRAGDQEDRPPTGPYDT